MAAELVPLACGGYVADTPGLREVGLWAVPTEELPLYFPEFEPFLDQCRFSGSCTHTHEPECGVREAVADFTRRSPWMAVGAAFAAGFLASGSKTTEQLLAEILKQAQRE